MQIYVELDMPRILQWRYRFKLPQLLLMVFLHVFGSFLTLQLKSSDTILQICYYNEFALLLSKEIVAPLSILSFTKLLVETGKAIPAWQMATTVELSPLRAPTISAVVTGNSALSASVWPKGQALSRVRTNQISQPVRLIRTTLVS